MFFDNKKFVVNVTTIYKQFNILVKAGGDNATGRKCL